MSHENVEIVRRGYEAFERGDVAAMLADVHPDLVSHRAPPQPDAGTWHGPEGLLEAIAGWIEGFDEFAMTVTDVIDANDTQVVPTHYDNFFSPLGTSQDFVTRVNLAEVPDEVRHVTRDAEVIGIKRVDAAMRSGV